MAIIPEVTVQLRADTGPIKEALDRIREEFEWLKAENSRLRREIGRPKRTLKRKLRS